MAVPYLNGAYEQEGEQLFMRVDNDRTRGNGLKLRQGRFRLDIRRKFFTKRVVMHWNRLPTEAVDAPSLKAFKARLDVALGSLVWWLANLHIAGGLKLDDHCGAFQPRFCDISCSERQLDAPFLRSGTAHRLSRRHSCYSPTGLPRAPLSPSGPHSHCQLQNDK